MFQRPKNAIHRRVSRRKFLELSGTGVSLLGAGTLGVSLGSVITSTRVQAQSSDEAKWKQYSGSRLVFLSENTPPSFAIREKLQDFYDLTGIEVEILTDDLPVVQQKAGIDLRSGTADYVLQYCQDKPIGSPFADFYADLTPLFGDDTLPQNPEGYDDGVWFENFLTACARFYDGDRVVSLPYDAAIATTFYRQDLFEANSPDFEAEYGYRLEFTPETTWKQVLDIAQFFKAAREAGKDVPYGYAQHQGSFAWTTQLDIQRLMFSHGQWIDFPIDDKLGSKDPGPTNWGDEQSVLLLEKFKALGDASHPDNLANGTLELNTVYQSGNIAMQVQYHEFAASVEDPSTSLAAGGKTAYAPCPKGEPEWILGGGQAVNGTNCGIGGIAINANASEDMQRAAYLFAIWSTSQENQLDILKGLGGTPTRRSVLEVPEVKEAMTRPSSMPNALTFEPVYGFGIRDPNFVLGPKIPQANEFHSIIAADTQAMLSGQMSPEETANSLKSKFDSMHGV